MSRRRVAVLIVIAVFSPALVGSPPETTDVWPPDTIVVFRVRKKVWATDDFIKHAARRKANGCGWDRPLAKS